MQPKLCPAGIWTVGYGHAVRDPGTGRFLRMPDKALALSLYPAMTESEAERLLLADIMAFSGGISTLLHLSVSANQFGAMVSLAYNIGLSAFTGSTLLKLVNQGDIQAAASQFERWNKSRGKVLRGLTLRRAEEKALFLKH